MKMLQALTGLRVVTLCGWALATSLQGQETPAAPANPAAAPVDAKVLEQVRELSPGVTYEVAQVAKLAKAGVGDSVIQAYVNSSRIVTPPRADELIYLSNHKVSPEVINALIKRGSELQLDADRARVAAATVAAAPVQAPIQVQAPAEPVYAQPAAPVYAQTVTPTYTYATYPDPSYVYTYSTPYYYYGGPTFGWSWSWYGGSCYAPYRGWYGYNRCAYPAPYGRYGGGYYGHPGGRPSGGGAYGRPGGYPSGGGRGAVSVGVGFAGGGGRGGVAVGGSFAGGGGRGGMAVSGGFAGGGGRGGMAAGGRHR